MNKASVAAALGMGLVLTCAPLQADQPAPNSLVEQWLSLEVQRGKLRSSWDERKIILDQQIRLLEEEAAALREVIDSHESSTTDAESERSEVLAQQDALEQRQESLEESIKVAVHRLNAERRRLPPPLQTSWEMKLKRLSDDSMSLSDRLDGILTLLTEFHEFEQRLATHSGNIEMPAENGEKNTRIMVTQVYLGTSHGWYVSADGSHYGYGESRPDGWRWWHNEATQNVLGSTLEPNEITALIQVVKNPDKATLTSLPLAIEPPSDSL